MKRNRQRVVNERWEKKQSYIRTEVQSEKFQEDRRKSIIPLTAKNDNQRLALQLFQSKQLILQSGSAGTGKTELACWWAAKLFLEGHVDNIVITRPHKHLGDDYGAVKGNDSEKLLPFCMSMLMKLKKYLGTGLLRSNFKIDPFDNLFSEVSGITIVPVEKIQGLSFNERTIIIADECQNNTVAQIKSLTTRMEEGCQIICCGDKLQTALKETNGLDYLERIVKLHPHEDIGIVYYTPKDSCRKGVAGHLTNAFEQEGNW